MYKKESTMSNKLLFYRKKFKLTQHQVADVMNLSQAQYQRLEKSQSVINATQIIALCELYKVTPNDLLGFEAAQKVQNYNEKKRIELLAMAKSMNMSMDELIAFIEAHKSMYDDVLKKEED